MAYTSKNTSGVCVKHFIIKFVWRSPILGLEERGHRKNCFNEKRVKWQTLYDKTDRHKAGFIPFYYVTSTTSNAYTQFQLFDFQSISVLLLHLYMFKREINTFKLNKLHNEWQDFLPIFKRCSQKMSIWMNNFVWHFYSVLEFLIENDPGDFEFQKKR